MKKGTNKCLLVSPVAKLFGAQRRDRTDLWLWQDGSKTRGLVLKGVSETGMEGRATRGRQWPGVSPISFWTAGVTLSPALQPAQELIWMQLTRSRQQHAKRCPRANTTSQTPHPYPDSATSLPAHLAQQWPREVPGPAPAST